MLLMRIFTYDPQMLLVLSIITLFSSLFWYYWSFIAPYSKLPSYIWIMDFSMLYNTLKKRRSGNTPLSHYLFQKLLDACKRHLREGICVIWGVEPYLIAFGEESVKLFSNESVATEKPEIYRYFKFLGGNGLFMSKGEAWKKQKKLVNPGFYTRMLKGIEPIMNKNGEILVQKLNELEGGITCEIEDLLKTCTLRIFFESILGIKADNFENTPKLKYFTSKLSECFEFIVYRAFSPWLYYDFALNFSSFAREHLKAREDVYDIVDEILQDLKRSISSRKSSTEQPEMVFDDNNNHRKTIGEVLLEEHLKDPSFTIEDVKCQLITLIVAGHDTLYHALEYSLFLLGLYPDVQEKAYDEIMMFADRDIQYNDLSKMVYMECVIKEALRIYPVAPLYSRRLKKDVYYRKYKIPKNATIVFFPYLLHRDPDIYPDPETFNPNRFMEGATKPWAYTPFAEGSRPCIGKNFAIMEMKILLVHILRNFKIVSLTRREDVVVSWELTLRCINPLRMQFIPR